MTRERGGAVFRAAPFLNLKQGGNQGLAIDTLFDPQVSAVLTSRESTSPPRLVVRLAGAPPSLPNRLFVPSAQDLGGRGASP